MIRTSPLLFWFGLTLCASLALYHTSDRVHALNRQLRQLNAQIEEEQRSIHVLKAEWVYLSTPARVQQMAKKHLALRPTAPKQVVAMSDLGDMIPTRAEAMGSVAVSTPPIATIKTSLAVPVPQARPRTIAVADNGGHINDHMVIQRTASAAPLPDSIGALIDGLDGMAR